MATRIDPAARASDQRSGEDRRKAEAPLPACLNGEDRRRSADRRARG